MVFARHGRRLLSGYGSRSTLYALALYQEVLVESNLGSIMYRLTHADELLRDAIAILPHDLAEESPALAAEIGTAWLRDPEGHLEASRYARTNGSTIPHVPEMIAYLQQMLLLARQFDAAIVPHPDRWPLFRQWFGGNAVEDGRAGAIVNLPAPSHVAAGVSERRFQLVAAVHGASASDDLSALDSILARIPAGQDWMRDIATAVVAARRLAVDDRQSLRHMVAAGFTLLRQLADQMHTAGLERLVDMQSRVIALDGDQLDPSVVGWLANLVNTLSMSAGNHTRLSSALAFADRLEAMPDAGAPTERLARFGALSNLITTCKQLAKTQPEGTESYLVRAAELALCVCRGRQAFVECCPDPAIGYQLVAQAIGNLMFACAELSRMNPARTARLSVVGTSSREGYGWDRGTARRARPARGRAARVGRLASAVARYSDIMHHK